MIMLQTNKVELGVKRTGKFRQESSLLADVMRPTANEIRAFREEFGLTQGLFAKLIGVDKMTIHRWEKNKLVPHAYLRHSLLYLRDYFTRTDEAKRKHYFYLLLNGDKRRTKKVVKHIVENLHV